MAVAQGGHIRHQHDVHRHLPQALDQPIDALLGSPGQGDHHLVDLFGADQLFQVAGIAQQRQAAQFLGNALGTVVDKTDQAGADVTVARQVFSHMHGRVGKAQDHGALEEFAVIHQMAVQAQHQYPLHAKQHQAHGKPGRQVAWAQLWEEQQDLVHEQQDAKRRDPGHQHHAKTQAVAEQILGVHPQSLEQNDGQERKKHQQAQVVVAHVLGDGVRVEQQNNGRHHSRKAVDQFHENDKKLNETGTSQKQAIDRRFTAHKSDPQYTTRTFLFVCSSIRQLCFTSGANRTTAVAG